MLDQAIAAIWQSLEAGVHYPAAWRGRLTVEQGYQVQLAILERLLQRGERQAGWKVGLTAQAIQKQVGYHEPVFGYLLESGERPSGAVLAQEQLISPCFETELCLTVGRTLRGPGVTLDQARAALTAAAPAFEIVERRGDFAADAALSMADNVQQKHFVTGKPLAPLPPDLDLAAVEARVTINGQEVVRALGAEVLGDPAASVAWLANKLAQFDRPLQGGLRVMAGSFAPQHALAPGQHVEARFSGVGPVSFSVR